MIIFFVFSISAYAQTSQPSSRINKTAEKDTIIPFKNRWAIKTNAVDWLAMLPNATVEFDLSNSVYNRLALGLGIKWNWNTRQNYKPAVIYNIFDVRAELRHYYRTELKNAASADGEKKSVFRKLKEDVFSKQKLSPRYWRAYYWGGYLNASNYTLKFGKRGIQGTSYGIGVSAGFSIPLYGYRGNAVDLELGGSLGFLYTKYDAFEHDPESNCYPRIPEKSKNWHLTPFPVVSDVRVAFVYRFSSIKNKYKLVDHKKIQAKQQKRFERKAAKDSIKEVRFKEKELETLFKDSVNRANRLQKENDKMAKQQADSLERIDKKRTKGEKRTKESKDEKVIPVTVEALKDTVKINSIDSVSTKYESISQPAKPEDLPLEMLFPPGMEDFEIVPESVPGNKSDIPQRDAEPAKVDAGILPEKQDANNNDKAE